MKSQRILIRFFTVLLASSTFLSCEQKNIDPNQVLDEVFIPDGFVQSESLSFDVQTRLEELRLEHPDNQYYYLEFINQNKTSLDDWIFPQKELKIEYIDYDKNQEIKSNPKLKGLIVKKIPGDWRKEDFLITDSRPEPVGGIQMLYSYIMENIQYPEEAKKKGIEGKVFIEFIVNEKGELTDVKAIKGIGAGCDEEAVRVLKEAPKWIPAKINDEAVRVKMILPVTYKLS